MIYLDSCALVKLVITEKETPALERHLARLQAAAVTCELALTEVLRVTRRSCYDAQRRLAVSHAELEERLAAAGALLDRVDRMLVNTTVFLRAGLWADDPHIGSLDAIHLVCAQEIGPELTSFITYDKALARAAVEAGLPVDQPV